ncbi:Dehydrogenase kinase [Ceraceosorus bombacis]|uniref:Protein-serine/threonine kinase n=1 Tax=Ceraceosorus bombacis TaxID=401625 RepID=A0A0P1B9A6_9BASI|nr:Dehydrogenase kinase [Ceraceosorus bombacis]
MDADANEEFTRELERMVEDHRENIPTLARGFLESKRYMSASAISAFLDGAIHSRIGIRLIAEQHLALTSSHTQGAASATSVGIIDTSLNAADLIRGCAEFVHALCETSLGCAPELKLEGDLGSTFCGVASHLTYTMTELLKNSYRATAERYIRRGGEAALGPMPSVKITVARSRKHLTMRIRDEGGGVPPAHFSKIFEYTFTTASSPSEEEVEISAMAGGGMAHPSELQNTSAVGVDVLSQMGAAGAGVGGGMGTLAGLGYGLPMSRIYAQHGRGSLDLVSMYGYGCDTFMKIRANPLDER